MRPNFWFCLSRRDRTGLAQGYGGPVLLGGAPLKTRWIDRKVLCAAASRNGNYIFTLSGFSTSPFREGAYRLSNRGIEQDVHRLLAETNPISEGAIRNQERSMSQYGFFLTPTISSLDPQQHHKDIRWGFHKTFGPLLSSSITHSNLTHILFSPLMLLME